MVSDARADEIKRNAARPKRAKTTVDRLRRRSKPYGRKGVPVTGTDQITKALDDVAKRALEYLDDRALAEAKGKELIDIAKKAVETSQLLKGLPTAIVGSAERSKMEEVLGKLVQEAERRGLIDGRAMVDITPKAKAHGSSGPQH